MGRFRLISTGPIGCLWRLFGALAGLASGGDTCQGQEVRIGVGVLRYPLERCQTGALRR